MTNKLALQTRNDLRPLDERGALVQQEHFRVKMVDVLRPGGSATGIVEAWNYQTTQWDRAGIQITVHDWTSRGGQQDDCYGHSFVMPGERVMCIEEHMTGRFEVIGAEHGLKRRGQVVAPVSAGGSGSAYILVGGVATTTTVTFVDSPADFDTGDTVLLFYFPTDGVWRAADAQSGAPAGGSVLFLAELNQAIKLPGASGSFLLMDWDDATGQYVTGTTAVTGTDEEFANCLFEGERVWLIRETKNVTGTPTVFYRIQGEHGLRRKAISTTQGSIACGGNGTADLLAPTATCNSSTKPAGGSITVCNGFGNRRLIYTDDEFSVQYDRPSQTWIADESETVIFAKGTLGADIDSTSNAGVTVNDVVPMNRYYSKCSATGITVTAENTYLLDGKAGDLVELRRNVRIPVGNTGEWEIIQVSKSRSEVLVGEATDDILPGSSDVYDLYDLVGGAWQSRGETEIAFNMTTQTLIAGVKCMLVRERAQYWAFPIELEPCTGTNPQN